MLKNNKMNETLTGVLILAVTIMIVIVAASMYIAAGWR